MQRPAAAAGDPPVALAASGCWRPREPLDLHWHDWGGDSVVFDERTGQTHQFSPLASAVMAWLEERPRSAFALTAAIAADLDTDADSELQGAVDAVIEQFSQLGWIETLTRA